MYIISSKRERELDLKINSKRYFSGDIEAFREHLRGATEASYEVQRATSLGRLFYGGFI